MDLMEKLLQKNVINVDDELFGIVCGSYRRLKMQSNDIDFLISHPKIITKDQLLKEKNNKLEKIVKILRKQKFIIDDLDKNMVSMYKGFCKLGPKYPVRRIDIKFVPYDSYYTALFHLTGSGDFNKKIRLTAMSLGYKLSEYEICKYVGKKCKRFKVKSEKDIFDILGLEYVQPKHR